MMKIKKDVLINKEYVNTLIVERKKDIHKGDCGRVLVIAGTKGMMGAAVLSATGAMRAGAGLVKVALEEALFPIVQIGIPEAICISRNSDINPEEFQAIVIGPGLGDDDNDRLIEKILKNYEGTIVFDADGLKALSKVKHLLEKTKCSLILTPHPGEAGRLLGVSSKEINKNRNSSAREIAIIYNAVVVLKGKDTVVATPDGATYINTTGNPGMATAGSGDVLAGIIAAFAGQGLAPIDSAACGVFIHGLAGDLGAKHYGEYGLIASDIVLNVGIAIKSMKDLTFDNP